MFKYLYWFSTQNTNGKCIFRIFCDMFYEFFFVGALAILLCSFNTAFSSKSKQSTPFSSKKSPHERLNESSRVCPVFPSLNCRTSSYISSNFFMFEDASHVESGSNPAGSFSTTTTNMPFSLYVVYIVSTIIMKKYVPTQPINTCLEAGNG